jgi:hypothetical protein
MHIEKWLYSNENNIDETQSSVLTRKVIVEKWPEKCNLIFKSIDVKVDTRKIRALWSPELAQELLDFKPIDVESEIINCLNKEISHLSTRKVLFEKFVIYSGPIMYGSGTWTEEFKFYMDNIPSSVLKDI